MRDNKVVSIPGAQRQFDHRNSVNKKKKDRNSVNKSKAKKKMIIPAVDDLCLLLFHI